MSSMQDALINAGLAPAPESKPQRRTPNGARKSWMEIHALVSQGTPVTVDNGVRANSVTATQVVGQRVHVTFGSGKTAQMAMDAIAYCNAREVKQTQGAKTEARKKQQLARKHARTPAPHQSPGKGK